MLQKHKINLLRINYVLFLYLIFVTTASFSQRPFSFIWPIDSPFVITGNYGELRPNHFHAGIDFSTSGKINLPVYCIEEGYVSRIRVSPYGYGKCVYITHPNGQVSVYAHLNAFSLKVAKLAQKNQYARQSYEIDFMPKPRTEYVRRNEIIGLSGNSGGSTGPHLHFEIRDEQSEIPINPLSIFSIKDHSAPEITSIAFYNLSDTTSPKLITTRKLRNGSGDSLIMENDHLNLNYSTIGLAFSGLDRFYPNGNKNNVYAAKIYFNDRLIYQHQLNYIAFDESRFINEFTDNVGRNKYQKCFLPTIYPMGMYRKSVDKGRLFLNDSVFSKIKIIFNDEAGNKSPVQFYLKAKKISGYITPEDKTKGYVNCSEQFISSENGLQIVIPAKTLFYSKNISINSTIEENGRFSILPDLNLKQAVTLAFKVPEKYNGNGEKLLLKGSSISLPTIRNDSVFFIIKNFGKYHLEMDTISPRIKIDYTEHKLKEAWQLDAFSFTIKDNESGIGSYNLWLNNDWVLSEYDAKLDLLTYYFDENTPMGILQFKLEVKDKVGNRTFLEYTLKK
jgi:hypothetical protein